MFVVELPCYPHAGNRWLTGMGEVKGIRQPRVFFRIAKEKIVGFADDPASDQ